MKIAITAESTIDLPKELLESYDIKTVSFGIIIDGKEGLDGEITATEIIESVAKTKVLPKTSAVNEFQYEEFFSSVLKDYDAIVHFSLSSKISSACSNAKAVAEKLKNVFVVDTLSLSTGIALLAIYARKLANRGLSPNDIYERCLKRVPFVQASFELKRLDFLYKGGRCSSLAYFGANLLKICPQILLKDGKMVSGKRYRGNFVRVVENYCNDTIEEFNTPDLSEAFVTYTTAPDEIVDIAVNALKDRGFKNIHITHAGATITSHCGENCLGILYINDGEQAI